MTDKNPVLVIKNLEVPRNKFFVLKVPSLQIRAGMITCVVGANGSGKTTLLETVSGLIQMYEGNIFIAGVGRPVDNKRLQRLIGYIPDDENWLIPELTAAEYFALLSSVYRAAGIKIDMTRRAALLSRKLHFVSHDQQIGELSHGNRKKVQIIAGLIHDPRLVIVDEIRNGLDPIVIRQAEQLLSYQAARGAAVVAATHDLWWSERIADAILMLHTGKVAVYENTKSIVQKSGSVEAKYMELFGVVS